MLKVHCTKKVAQILFAGHQSIRVRRPTSHIVSPAAHFRFRTFQCTTMASSVSDIIQKLEGFNLKSAATVSHTETTSPASWKNALIVSGSAPSSFELIKTLVYKSKTAKTAAPVVVIAREETEVNSGAVAKKLNLKDLRLASEDLLAEFFSLDKNSCTFEKSRCNDLTCLILFCSIPTFHYRI